MAKVSKNELGKGIRALLGNQEVKEPSEQSTQPLAGVEMVDVSQIETNPYQPRNVFDPDALEDLATSIRTYGLIQPVTLRRLGTDAYQLIAGERRLRASRLAGLAQIPAYIRTADDQEMLEMALVENIQRHDLNALEIAISYQRLIDECGLTHESMSDRVGKKRSTISNYLRLLKLPPLVQEALVKQKISMGHARALLSIENDFEQIAALEQILTKDLSVRATEDLLRNWGQGPADSTSGPSRKNPYVKEIEDQLARQLGTRVVVKRAASGKGSIQINFGSDDDLNRILDAIEGS